MISINEKDFEKEIVIEIGKFAILWNIFEKEKCKNDCNIDKLAQLVKEKETDQFWKSLAKVLKERLGARDCNVDDYINSHLSQGRGMKKLEKIYVKEFIDTDGERNLVGGLIAIYRIRNNMFHGLKDWTCLGGQLKLFEGINEFLTQAIKRL